MAFLGNWDTSRYTRQLQYLGNNKYASGCRRFSYVILILCALAGTAFLYVTAAVELQFTTTTYSMGLVYTKYRYQKVGVETDKVTAVNPEPSKGDTWLFYKKRDAQAITTSRSAEQATETGSNQQTASKSQEEDAVQTGSIESSTTADDNDAASTDTKNAVSYDDKTVGHRFTGPIWFGISKRYGSTTQSTPSSDSKDDKNKNKVKKRIFLFDTDLAIQEDIAGPLTQEAQNWQFAVYVPMALASLLSLVVLGISVAELSNHFQRVEYGWLDLPTVLAFFALVGMIVQLVLVSKIPPMLRNSALAPPKQNAQQSTQQLKTVMDNLTYLPKATVNKAYLGISIAIIAVWSIYIFLKISKSCRTANSGPSEVASSSSTVDLLQQEQGAPEMTQIRVA